MRYAFESLGMSEIIASTDYENTASVRVIENIGMSLYRRKKVDGLDTLFYRLDKNPQSQH